MKTNADLMADILAKLPAPARAEVHGLIMEALLWRGWDSVRAEEKGWPIHAVRCIQKVNDILEANGIGLEQYT